MVGFFFGSSYMNFSYDAMSLFIQFIIANLPGPNYFLKGLSPLMPFTAPFDLSLTSFLISEPSFLTLPTTSPLIRPQTFHSRTIQAQNQLLVLLLKTL